MADSNLNAANLAEVKAYRLVKRTLGDVEPFAKPAGSATTFPDFGFRIYVKRKPIDIHIEYKLDAKAQMGSMRDWIFDGQKYMTPSTRDMSKEELINAMNTNALSVKRGKELLNDFKKYYDKRVNKISSSMLAIEPDQKLRRKKLINFVNNTDNYQIAKIASNEMGTKIIEHYKHKFTKVMRPDSSGSVLYMMLGNEIYFISSRSVDNDTLKKINGLFTEKQIPRLTGIAAQLEVRIQPRGLSSSEGTVRIDVMASFRLAGKSSPGALIT